jgi:hypothetical protein
MAVEYYLVTFDLINSKGRESEYATVKNRLRLLVGPQNFCRVVKQCCLIRTKLDAKTIRQSVEQTIGSQSNTLILPVRRGYSLRVKDPATRNAAIDFLKSIPRD